MMLEGGKEGCGQQILHVFPNKVIGLWREGGREGVAVQVVGKGNTITYQDLNIFDKIIVYIYTSIYYILY